MPVTRARHMAPATNSPIATSTATAARTLDLATLAAIKAMRGEREEAERELSKLEMLSDSRYVCPYEIATARAALGQRDQAFRWLRRAVDDRSVCVPDLKTDPRLDSLRTTRGSRRCCARWAFCPERLEHQLVAAEDDFPTEDLARRRQVGFVGQRIERPRNDVREH